MTNRTPAIPTEIDYILKRTFITYPDLEEAVHELMATKDEDSQFSLIRKFLWTPSYQWTPTVEDDALYTKVGLTDIEKSSLIGWIPNHPVAVQWQYENESYYVLRKYLVRGAWGFFEEDVPFLIKNENALHDWRFLGIAYEINPVATMLLFSRFGSKELEEKGILFGLMRYADTTKDQAVEEVTKAACVRVREILGLDEEIPDSWVNRIVLTKAAV